MMDPIQAAINELEARARRSQLAAQRFTEAAAALRAALAAFNEPIESPAVKVEPKASPQTRLARVSAPRDQSTEGVAADAIVRQLGAGDMRGAALVASVKSATKLPDWKIRQALARLVDAGRVRRSGMTTSTRYQLAEGSHGQPQTADAAAEPVKQAEPAPSPAAKTRATVAAYLMREVFDGQVPQHVGDIPTLLEPVFGRLGYDEIVSVLDELVKENALISFRKGRELHYRRQTETPSDVQPIIVDLKSLKAALRSGASQSIADIHRAMRVAWPELTLEALGRTLDELARTKQVDVLSVGTTRRYRLTAKGAA